MKKHSAKSHAAENPFECEVCSYRAKWKKDVLKHMKRKKHTGFILKTWKGNKSKLPGLTSEELEEHLAETDAAGKPYECEVCSFRSKWKENVKKHMKNYNHIGFILETRQGNQRKLPGLTSEDVE